MTRKTDKKRSHKKINDLRARVREILMNEWDPIGIAAIPGTSDEYDSYVSKICTMLMEEQADVYRITAYLDRIATQSMRLSPSEAGLPVRRTAAALIVARSDFERP